MSAACGNPARRGRAAVSGRLPGWAGLVFCAVILWALLNNLVSPHYGASRYQTGWALAAAVGVLALMLAFYRLLGPAAAAFDRHRAFRLLASAGVWTALFAVQLRVAYAVRLPADWDAYAVYQSAAGLALGSAATVDTGYFQTNPNNLVLTLLVAAYYDLALFLGFTDLQIATAFLNALVLFIGSVLTYWAARMLGGRKPAAFTLLPSTILMVLSPWAGVLYSDTVGLLFTILILCLLLAARRSSRLAVRVPLWILAGAVGAVGYGIKPTVLICLVAAGITALCMLGRRSAGVLLLAVAAVGGSFFIGTQLITAFERQSSAVAFDVSENPHAMPVTHFLKVGSQPSDGPYGPFYGAYKQADYDSTVAITDPGEKFRHGLDTYAARVSDMGPAGYAWFLNGKLLWMTGDGSFFAWGEGRLTGAHFLSQDPVDRTIQDFYGNTRPLFPWLLSLWQGTWFVVLALVAVPLFLRTPRLLRPELSAMRIALLGLVVFLLLFENRARFLYLYVPYFILLASFSLHAVVDRLEDVRARRNLRQAGQAAVPAPGAQTVD